MHISEHGLALIKHYEGFSPTAYLCAGGVRTIGYGHLLRVGRHVHEPLTQEAAHQLLAEDVKHAEKAITRLIQVPLTQGQFDALVSFTFNLGAGAFQRSGLRQKVNRAEHGQVPEEFMKWVWAGGRRLRGLVVRRKAEAALYLREYL